jgi:hypothetical protein
MRKALRPTTANVCLRPQWVKGEEFVNSHLPDMPFFAAFGKETDKPGSFPSRTEK